MKTATKPEAIPLPRPVCCDKHGTEECTLLAGHPGPHISGGKSKTWK